LINKYVVVSVNLQRQYNGRHSLAQEVAVFEFAFDKVLALE
jgi:hypothetical protein